MPTQAEHYRIAEALLEEGRDVVRRIGISAKSRSEALETLSEEASELMDEAITEVMDELGKKAMGIWAQAQVHATLATATVTMSTRPRPAPKRGSLRGSDA